MKDIYILDEFKCTSFHLLNAIHILFQWELFIFLLFNELPELHTELFLCWWRGTPVPKIPKCCLMVLHCSCISDGQGPMPSAAPPPASSCPSAPRLGTVWEPRCSTNILGDSEGIIWGLCSFQKSNLDREVPGLRKGPTGLCGCLLTPHIIGESHCVPSGSGRLHGKWGKLVRAGSCGAEGKPERHLWYQCSLKTGYSSPRVHQGPSVGERTEEGKWVSSLLQSGFCQAIFRLKNRPQASHKELGLITSIPAQSQASLCGGHSDTNTVSNLANLFSV